MYCYVKTKRTQNKNQFQINTFIFITFDWHVSKFKESRELEHTESDGVRQQVFFFVLKWSFLRFFVCIKRLLVLNVLAPSCWPHVLNGENFNAMLVIFFSFFSYSVFAWQVVNYRSIYTVKVDTHKFWHVETKHFFLFFIFLSTQFFFVWKLPLPYFHYNCEYFWAV